MSNSYKPCTKETHTKAASLLTTKPHTIHKITKHPKTNQNTCKVLLTGNTHISYTPSSCSCLFSQRNTTRKNTDTEATYCLFLLAQFKATNKAQTNTVAHKKPTLLLLLCHSNMHTHRNNTYTQTMLSVVSSTASPKTTQKTI
jgi:hypothetical protein